MGPSIRPENAPGLDYASPAATPRRQRSWLLHFLLVAALGLLVASLFLPSFRSLQQSGRVKCAENLRQIVMAAIMYAQNNGGQFPQSEQAILSAAAFSSDVFVCPSTNDTPTTGATKNQIVANLTAGGHLSYIYCGQGVTLDMDAGVVVAIDPLANHGGEGIYAAFSDAHVEWLTAPQAQQILDQINSGTRPVRWPPLESAEPEGPRRRP